MLKKLLVPTLVLTMSAIAGIGCRDDSGDATPYVPPADASGDAPTDGGSPDTEETDAEPTDAPPSDAPKADASGDASDATTTDATSDATGG